MRAKRTYLKLPENFKDMNNSECIFQKNMVFRHSQQIRKLNEFLKLFVYIYILIIFILKIKQTILDLLRNNLNS